MDLAFSAANWLLTDNATTTTTTTNEQSNTKPTSKTPPKETLLEKAMDSPKWIIDEEEGEDTTTAEILSLPDSGNVGDDEMDEDSSGIGSLLDDDRVGMQHEEEEATKDAKAKVDEESPALAEPTTTPATTTNKEGGGEDGDGNDKNNKKCPIVPRPDPTPRFIPLIDHLCRQFQCNLQQLQLLLFNIDARRRIIAHLREGFELRTSHLRPATLNIPLNCDDFSCQTATNVFAFNGFLNITVRQYYFCKHKLSLRHPYLPCLIVFGGGKHRSYYPLEVVAVRKLTN